MILKTIKYIIVFLLFLLSIYSLAQTDSINFSYSINPYKQQNFFFESPFQESIIYDVNLKKYIIYKKIGNTIINDPIYISPEKFFDYLTKIRQKQYYQEQLKILEIKNKTIKESINLNSKNFLSAIEIQSNFFDLIFGGNKIEFIPQGFASIELGILEKTDNQQLIISKNQFNFSLNLKQKIQLNLLGKIGNNLELKADYDTQEEFSIKNRINLNWKPSNLFNNSNLSKKIKLNNEDRIIQNIQFGNINMPLSTSLIKVAQSLFGIKIELQFGKTSITSILAENQTQEKNIIIENGYLLKNFKLNPIDYEDNQHYFISHFFESNYDKWLQNYPIIDSKINIIRIEVWKINIEKNSIPLEQSIIAIRDLGESLNYTNILPNNSNENIYNNIVKIRNSSLGNFSIQKSNLTSLTSTITPFEAKYKQGEHFIVNKKTRKLNPSEYKFNNKLGYISLNERLADNQLLAISFQYTKNDNPGVIYQVGEFSEETTNLIITKLLKSNTNIRTNSPLWDLMMKNIYKLPSYPINQNNFILNVFFKDKIGKKLNYFPDISKNPIIQILNWDHLKISNDNFSTQIEDKDGIFDFIPGITIYPEQGKIIHTKVRPYAFDNNYPNKYRFIDLYTNLKEQAKKHVLAYKYSIEGKYQEKENNEISLGAINLSSNSVSVTANGETLTEGIDYKIDYQLGNIKILNQDLNNSNIPIQISIENQSKFNTKKKRFLGISSEHKFSDKFILKTTFLNSKEQDFTKKNISFKEINNSILGIHLQYQKKNRFLTKLINKIPGIKTDVPSSINIKGEVAYLIPDNKLNKKKEVYIDNFESNSLKISLKDPNKWFLSSKPITINSNNNSNDLSYGYKRALSSWYFIDPLFFGVNGNLPLGINNTSLSKHNTRPVEIREIFSKNDSTIEKEEFINTFDFTIYPKKRGPYNFNKNYEFPQTRWAGIMRSLNISNFIKSNIEYIEFWMMNPHADGNLIGTNPKLKIHLGNISEDVLKDGNLQYENGLPNNINSKVETTESNWGIQPKNSGIVYMFDTKEINHITQDTGIDGLSSQEEIKKFGFFSDKPNDPSADDFVFYFDKIFNSEQEILNRYQYFRNPEGNSSYPETLSTLNQIPDVEDLNNDFNLDTIENYNEYEIPLSNSEMILGKNNIVDEKEVNIIFKNGISSKVKWYLYRIPIKNFNSTTESNRDLGNQILNNVRYIRMIAEGFEETSTIRLGTFDLLCTDWKRYDKEISNSSLEGVSIINNSNLETGFINIKENTRDHFPYILPHGILQKEMIKSNEFQAFNGTSLFINLNSLNPNDSRSVFKHMKLNLNQSKKIKLFVHAHDLDDIHSSNYDNKTKFFIRIGKDLSDNYYEYEISLKYTSKNDIFSFQIWPIENIINLDMKKLIEAKLERDHNNFDINSRFDSYSKNNQYQKIYIKGHPSIDNIISVMFGVRNLDIVKRSMTIWINEFKIEEVKNKNREYATSTNVEINIADFAQINTKAKINTSEFNTINKYLTKSSQENIKQYSINGNIHIDKFIPKKIKLNFPVTFNYEERIIDPKYNSQYSNIKLNNISKKKLTKQDIKIYEKTRTIGINRLKKETNNLHTKKQFYNLENFTASIFYSDTHLKDIYSNQNINQNLNASLDYDYSFKNWSYEPFKKLNLNTKNNTKTLQFITQLNFNPMPSRISFKIDLQRIYNQIDIININNIISELIPQNSIFTTNFLFNWTYNIKFNLTKSFNINFNSTTRNSVDHINSIKSPNKRLIWNHLTNLGRPILYNHKLQLNYRLPTQFISYLNFINAELNYTIKYNWKSHSNIFTRDNKNIGNIAKNNKNKNLVGNFDFNKFYKNFNIFKKIDSITLEMSRQLDSIQKLNNENKTTKKLFISKYKYKLNHYPYLLLSMIKTAQFNYNETSGILLPGLLSKPNFLGQGIINNKKIGPTTGFLLASQIDIRKKAIKHGWISLSDVLNEQYTSTKNKYFTGKIQIKISNNFYVDLNFMKNFNETITEFQYNLNTSKMPIENYSTNFSTSIFTLPTAFKSSLKLYEKLLNNSEIISYRIRNTFNNLKINQLKNKYKINNSNKLIIAFLSAFTGKNANFIKLNTYKPSISIPNWEITYTSLISLKKLKKYIFKVDITHSQISTYTVITNFQSNLKDYNKYLTSTNTNEKLFTNNIFANATILEEFNPLIGINIIMKNFILFKIKYNQNRLSSINLNDFTMNQKLNREFIFGLGYIFQNLKFNLNFKENQKLIISNLNIHSDLSIINTTIKLRELTQNNCKIISGKNFINLKLSADYNLNKNLNLKLFYYQNITDYKKSSIFPFNNIQAGISAIFKFGN